MLKQCACAVLIGILMTACTTVDINTVPTSAQIHFQDGTVAQSPYTLTIPLFATAILNIKQEGFFDETLRLQRFARGTQTIRLSPIYSLASTPTEATVSINGNVIGKTPLDFKLPHLDQTTTLTVARQGFITKTIAVTPNTPNRTLACTLAKDGPGRHAYRLKFTNYGFPILKQVHEETLKLDQAPQDKAVSLLAFQPERFPAYITSVPQSSNLLVLCLQNRKSGTFSKPLATVMLFNPEEQTLTTYTAGRYFDLSATIAGDTVFYSSMQTGRFDIWSRNQNPKQPPPQLVLSNNQIKCQLTARGNALLFTAFNPKHTNDPRIWIATIDQNYLTDLRELCNGEQPAWTHHGRNIIYQKNERGKNSTWFPKTKLWTVMTDGSLKRKLSDDSDCIDKNPVWTPDDQRIIFASNRNQKQANNFNLWIMDANGKNPRQITHSSAVDDCPVPTPDGKAVIFRSNRNLQWGLWKINLPE